VQHEAGAALAEDVGAAAGAPKGLKEIVILYGIVVMEGKNEAKVWGELPNRLKDVVLRHMQYYEGVEGQSVKDYLEYPISYILNFMLEVETFSKFCPRSYSKARAKQSHEDLIKLVLHQKENKKVIGKMKDECQGDVLTEFVGLRPIIYSLQI